MVALKQIVGQKGLQLRRCALLIQQVLWHSPGAAARAAKERAATARAGPSRTAAPHVCGCGRLHGADAAGGYRCSQAGGRGSARRNVAGLTLTGCACKEVLGVLIVDRLGLNGRIIKLAPIQRLLSLQQQTVSRNALKLR